MRSGAARQYCHVMRLLFLLPLLLLSCNQPAPATQTPGETTANAAPATTTIKNETVSADWEIIPGKRIGNTALGDDPEMLLQRLGKPDASDAAMGKAWLVWDGANSNNTLAVFTTYADSTMMRKAIRQIRVTSPRFQTADGIRTGTKFPEIRRAFPELKASENTFPEAAPRYDVVSRGISFEFSGKSDADSCTAILIYPTGDNPTAYLPIPH